MKPTHPPSTETPNAKSSLLGDVALPALLTLLILFCLTQVGLSFMSPGANPTADNDEQYAAISAFAN